MREAMTVRALDREADERRERLNSTLDELASGLTPGRVLDEVLSYAKSGGSIGQLDAWRERRNLGRGRGGGLGDGGRHGHQQPGREKRRKKMLGFF